MKSTVKYALCMLLALSVTGCAVRSSDTIIVEEYLHQDEVDISEQFKNPVAIAGGGAATEEPNIPEQDEQHAVTTEVTTQTEETSEPAQPEPQETQPPQTTAVTTAQTTTATTTAATTTATTAATTTTAQTTTTTAATTTTSLSTIDIPVNEPVVIEENAYVAMNYSEVKGVWISYLEYLEMMSGKSESQFRACISEALDNIEELGLNTVYVHARSHGDAYYESELFPWSKYASGSMDISPGYDPLEIMVEEAHQRDISIHAWINPLRLCGTADMSDYGDYIVSDWLEDYRTKGKYVVAVNGSYYLNPAYEEVIDLICDGAAEIVANYNVDGLHIDDYFYPTTDESFDRDAYLASGVDLLSDFRFDNCDLLVESLYEAVKEANSTALFSVSVQGSIDNNYNQLYADVERWCCVDGYLDYIVPQIYYGFDNSTQPYSECLSRWEDICSAGGVPLVVGLSVSKIGYEDTWAGAGADEWQNDSSILARQLLEAMECVSYGGACLYSYRSIYSAESSVKQQVLAEIEEFSAIIK